MTGSLDQIWEPRDAWAPRPSRTAAVARLVPPMVAFVVVGGMTWTLLNGPAESSADPCGGTRCAAVAEAAVGAPAKRKAVAPAAVPVRGPHLRITLYDPALEPLVEQPWDAQRRVGPEAPARTLPGIPWIRLSPLDVADQEACLIIRDRHLGCLKLPRRDTRVVPS